MSEDAKSARVPGAHGGEAPVGTAKNRADASRAAGVSRRGLLTGAAVVGGAAVGAAGGGVIASAQAADPPPTPDPQLVSFFGPHQAGIATPVQDRLVFASFDVISTSRDDLVAMLKEWTHAARKLVLGQPIGPVAGEPLAPPADTGEAEGLPAANLTLTIGFGPSLFDERFGLASRKPSALADIPALPGDALDPARSGGDICIQACADDAQVAFHAVRNLLRIGRGTVVMKWCQLGFGRAATTSRSQSTPRNLMGFKDGTNNIVGEDKKAMDSFVWVGSESDQDWMRGGSYLVTRRIRMLIEAWDRDRLEDQETVIGRQKVGGAPLGAVRERDKVPLTKKKSEKGKEGELLIEPDAHIRLAAPENNNGKKILRRGYSFTDGMDPLTGQLDSGLFFICFQKDPLAQFAEIQRKLGASDLLNEYIKHVGSAVFACPPGLTRQGWWGQHLFA